MSRMVCIPRVFPDLRAIRRQGRVLAAFAAILVVGGFSDAWGQTTTCPITNNGKGASCSTSFSIAMTVQKTVMLDVDPSALTLPNLDVSSIDYAAGFKTAGSLALTGRTNDNSSPGGMAVTIAAAAANFTYTGNASPAPNKTVGTLQWSTNGGTTWNNTSQTGATVLSTTAPTAGANQTVTFRTGLGWTTDPPGTYTLTLNFTITAP
jgi:hypothetical protein